MGFWNNLGKAADKTYSTTMTVAGAITSYLEKHPEVKAQYDKMGVPFQAQDLPNTPEYRDVPCNMYLPGGKVVHTVGELYDYCEDYWKNHREE